MLEVVNFAGGGISKELMVCEVMTWRWQRLSDGLRGNLGKREMTRAATEALEVLKVRLPAP